VFVLACAFNACILGPDETTSHDRSNCRDVMMMMMLEAWNRLAEGGGQGMCDWDF
jgi:hypothetical protein